MKPVVSVIIPAFNASKTIDKCIDSVLSQTIDVEVIVVNDNSSDDTLEKLKKYKDKIILINNKKNLGPAASRNKALDKATGTYVGFVDSDDYINPRMYEEMAKYMSDEVDLVCCGRFNVTKSGMTPVINKSTETDAHKFSVTSNYNTDKLFKRSIIEEHKLRLPEKYMYAEDFAFGIRYKYYANKMHIIPEPYYYYLSDSEGSITNRYDNTLFNIIDVLQEMVDFFKEQGDFLKYQKELVTLCAGFYVRRTREFKYFDDVELQKEYVRRFLDFFKKNFKHYVHAVNGFKTKYYRFYRCSYPLMCLYIKIVHGSGKRNEKVT